MSKEKELDDAQLGDVTGASGVLSHLAQDDGSGDGSNDAEIGKSPPAGGGPGPEDESGGGGNEDLGI